MTRADIESYVTEQILIGAPDGIYVPLHANCGYVFYIYPRSKDIGDFLDARGTRPMPHPGAPLDEEPYIQCLSCGVTDSWEARKTPDVAGNEGGDILDAIIRHLPEGLR